MSSTSETGHAKNVTNFEELISIVTSYDKDYNPAKSALTVTALNSQLATVKDSLAEVNSVFPAYTLSIADRETSFAQLSKLLTRVISALKASETTKHVNDDVLTIVRKLQGRRANPKMSQEDKTEAAANGKIVVEISSSQMSYDSRLENLDKLIKLLSSIPQYTPNEADLKLTGLTAYYNLLKAKNSAVLAAEPALTNARNSRNNLLYKENTGLVDVAMNVKTYIKSVYGASSPQYKKISSIKFTKTA
jgi:hypothetical protein